MEKQEQNRLLITTLRRIPWQESKKVCGHCSDLSVNQLTYYLTDEWQTTNATFKALFSASLGVS